MSFSVLSYSILIRKGRGGVELETTYIVSMLRYVFRDFVFKGQRLHTNVKGYHSHYST